MPGKHRRAVGEQREQRRVASGDPGQAGGETLDPLLQRGALGRAHRRSRRLDPLLTQQQRDSLELRAHRRGHATSAKIGQSHGEDGDRSLLLKSGRPVLPLRRRTATRFGVLPRRARLCSPRRGIAVI